MLCLIFKAFLKRKDRGDKLEHMVDRHPSGKIIEPLGSLDTVKQVEPPVGNITIIHHIGQGQTDIITPREHLEDYHVSNNWLYPDGILILSMATKFNTGNNDFPHY